jgi:hypothetical protein
MEGIVRPGIFSGNFPGFLFWFWKIFVRNFEWINSDRFFVSKFFSENFSRAGKFFRKIFWPGTLTTNPFRIPDPALPISPDSTSRRRKLPVGVPPRQIPSTSQIGLFLPNGAIIWRFE